MSKMKEMTMATLVKGTKVLDLTIYNAFGAHRMYVQQRTPISEYQNTYDSDMQYKPWNILWTANISDDTNIPATITKHVVNTP